MRLKLKHLIQGLTAILLVLGCISAMPGQATIPATRAVAVPPTGRVDAFLDPFIDGETTVVAHLDAAAIDTAAIEKYLLAPLDEAKVPADDPTRQQIGAARAAADVFLARFKQLGGRHVYLVMSHPDIWPHMQPLAILLKIEPGGDARMLRQLIATLGFPELSQDDAPAATSPDDAARREAQGALKAAMLRQDVLFIGQDVPLQRLKTLKPARRPELAFGATPMALEAAAALTADERRALRELMPALPPELGGGSTQVLTRDDFHLRLEVSLPPAPSVTISWPWPGDLPLNTYGGATLVNDGKLTLKDDFGDLIVQLRDRLLDSDEFKKALADPELKTIAPELQAIVKDVLTPRGGKLQADGGQFARLLRLAVPLSFAARERGLEAQTAAYARGIAQSANVYAADNKDMLPESMEVMVKNGQIAEKQTYSPRDPKHRKFIYKLIIPVNITDARIPLVWEDVDP
ncbi:MAG TPA: hypothetical protein VHM90_02995, partial [Phycisphaerae bacterium]|nr:hypothetical protein [Phycisphaerae bacterium]